jgi:hypothetical protein
MPSCGLGDRRERLQRPVVTTDEFEADPEEVIVGSAGLEVSGVPANQQSLRIKVFHAEQVARR